MAERLKGKKAATQEIRKILLRQIDKALDPLRGRIAADSRIHDVRKQLKMARATLRLLRKALPKSQYRSENDQLRDAARPLSATRDAAVLLDVIGQLFDKAHRTARPPGANRLALLSARERSVAREAITARHGLSHSRRLLHRAKKRASRWRLASKGWSVIGAGLQRVYGQGRDAFEVVCKSPSDASFHEWRKQTKYLRYELKLLEPACPGVLDALERKLHTLADHLGNDHDLAVLREKINNSRDLFTDDSGRLMLLEMINRRRNSLQLDALHLGAQLYEESPRRFRTRMGRYWRHWRHGPVLTR